MRGGDARVDGNMEKRLGHVLDGCPRVARRAQMHGELLAPAERSEDADRDEAARPPVKTRPRPDRSPRRLGEEPLEVRVQTSALGFGGLDMGVAEHLTTHPHPVLIARRLVLRHVHLVDLARERGLVRHHTEARARHRSTARSIRRVNLTPLLAPANTKILLVVLDGLGGMADGSVGTELEDADTPNLDALAAGGVSGLLEPVGPGITPGSGPGHLALFGYDPLAYQLGRGTLSAAGLGVELRAGDVAARGNLCTIGPDGTVVDRRAARLPDDEALRVIEGLNARLHVEGVDVSFTHEKSHRVLVVIRGEALDPRVSDTDPQHEGVPPLAPRALDPAAARTAEFAAAVIAEARRVLADEPVANGLLLRGFDSHRDLPPFRDRTGLRAAAASVYPMYRGIARLLGFEVLGPPADLADEVELLGKYWSDFDFFFLHHKDPDAAGEDVDRDAKIAAIERIDAVVPDLVELEPNVMAVTGDHATPSQLGAHSWHPVPVLIHGPRAGRDDVQRFGERWCRAGALGLRPSTHVLPILLANGGRLAKYGA